MSEPPIALIVAIMVLIFVAGFGGTLYFQRDLFGLLLSMLRSKVVAEAEVESIEPHRFALRYLTQDSRPHRVCLKVHLWAESDSLSLACAYQVAVGGQAVAQEVIGYGRQPPPPFERHITRTFFSVQSKTLSRYTKKGTIILTEIEPCAPGTEIVVEGTIRLGPGTQAEQLSVSLRG